MPPEIVNQRRKVLFEIRDVGRGQPAENKLPVAIVSRVESTVEPLAKKLLDVKGHRTK